MSKICRLCSSRLLKASQRKARKERQRRTYPVKKYAGLIKTHFGIDVGKDVPNIHPARFCNGCRTAMTNFARRPASITADIKKRSVKDVDGKWNEIGGNVSSCFMCNTFTQQCKPGLNAQKVIPPTSSRTVLSEVQLRGSQ